MRSVRIQSDGTPNGTKITTDGGTVIPNVTSAVIRIETGNVATVDLEIVLPMFDTNGLLDEITYNCPVCTKQMIHNCREEIIGGATNS